MPSKTKPATPSAQQPKPSRIAAVVALLSRADGATLAEITETTSWQPHSARAALTGLGKKGHVIEKSRSNEKTVYRIAQSA